MKRALAMAIALAIAVQFCVVGAAAGEAGAEGKIPLKIVAEAVQETVYNGGTQYPAAVTEPEGAALRYSVEPRNAGEYAVTISAADEARYEAEPVKVDFTIRKAVAGLDPYCGFVVSKKTYDGTTDASGMVILTTQVSGECPTATADFAFVDADAGMDKPVLVRNIALEPEWVGNYALNTAYDFAGNPVTSAIDPVSCSVTIQGELQQPVGAVSPLSVVTEPAGIPYTLTYNGSAQVPSAEGRYQVLASAAGPNYSGLDQVTLIVGNPAEVEAESAGITDAVLEAAVREVLKKPDGVITPADMENVGALTLSGVKNLSGLEHAHKLRRLLITDSPDLMSLEPLAANENLNLELLSITGTGITAFPELKLGSTGKRLLTEVTLSDNSALDDISGLASIPNLSKLTMSGCAALKEISPLEGCTKLALLIIHDSALTDTSFDGFQLGALSGLELNGSREITAVSGIAQAAAGLKRLDLVDTGVNDLTGIKGCIEIALLNISGTSPTEESLAELAETACLTHVYVNRLYGGDTEKGNALVQKLLGTADSLTALGSGIQWMELSGLGMDDPGVLQKLGEIASTKTAKRFRFINLSDNKFMASRYVENAVGRLRNGDITVWFQGQNPSPDALPEPPVTVGGYELMAVVQAPINALAGSLTSIKLTCRNIGTAPVPEGSKLEVKLPDTVTDAYGSGTLVLAQPLNPGEQAELSQSFKVPAEGVGTLDMRAFLTPAESGREEIAAVKVSVIQATLTAPSKVAAGKPFFVFGEKPTGATVEIEVSKDGETWAAAQLTAAGIKDTGNWYSAQVLRLAEGDYQLRVAVSKSGERNETEPVKVSSLENYLALADLYVQNGAEKIESNESTGIPTFSAWTDPRLIGRTFTPFVKFTDGSSAEIQSVLFQFGGVEVQAAKDEAGYYTAPIVKWSTTGVKQVTAVVTTKSGDTHLFTIAQVTVLIDPSGVIYDQRSGEPVTGAVVTLYQWENNGWAKWDTLGRMQVNPQTTDADGAYGWMVPEGIYQVRVTAEGYADAVRGAAPGEEGEQIVIPPVRTDVDFQLYKPQTLEDAKAAVEAWLAGLAVTNGTAAEEILLGAGSCITDARMTVGWKAGGTFTKTEATSVAAGQITGTLELALGGATAEVSFTLAIAKLPDNSGTDDGSGGSSGDNGSSGSGGGFIGGGGKPAVVPKKETETAVDKEAFAKLTDVSGHWAEDGIRLVVERGLFKGTGDTVFSPDMNMTRSMAVTVLYRLAGQPEGKKGNTGFADIPAGAWYADAVTWAAEAKIVTGTGEGFLPDGLLTREQLAVMLYQYAKVTGLEPASYPGNTHYADAAEISAWAEEAMAWAVGEGILNGYPDSTLKPGASATRAEVSTMLLRFLKLIEGTKA